MPIHYSKDEQNIVTLTLDHAGQVNLIDADFLREFAEMVSRLSRESPLAGVILASAKETFVAGADINLLFAMNDPAVAFDAIESFKATLRALETLGKPVVAILNGSALGGGFEIALACHHRIALEKPQADGKGSPARFGLPEVTLGVLPAGGGVTRFTRMFGLQTALPWLVEGAQLAAREALEAGWIDELASSTQEMIQKAREWILSHPRVEQPWDRSGFRIPGGDPRRPQVMSQVLPIAPAMLVQRTHRNYPAPEAILSAAVEGAMVDFATASRIESRYFAKLVTGPIAKNMMTALWYQLNDIKRGRSRPRAEPK